MNIDIMTSRIKKDIEAVAKFNSTPNDGLTILPFSKEARGAVEYLRTEMERIGLSVREDAAGNLIGRMEGTDSQAPAIVIASHYDTVKNGGIFDGIAGIVTGLEVVRSFKDNNITPKMPIEVIATNDEEGMRYGTGFFGTKAILGELTQDYLKHYKDSDGISIYDSMIEYGLVPEEIAKAKRNYKKEIKAFFEVHVEQGPVLETNKKELGLVECIVGMQRYIVTIKGRPDHAGTTPMPMRIDAMDCASKVISKISDWAIEEGKGTVATVGFAQVLPNAMNIISRQVDFSIDIRSQDEKCIVNIFNKTKDLLEQVCSGKGASYSIDEKLKVSPVFLNEKMLSLLAKSCEKYSYSYQRMLSGAGHDSLAVGNLIDTVMIFVPSKNGRSHCKEEWSEYTDFAKATQILCDTILELDK